MKNSILFGCVLLLCLFPGCFEDEGNYDYKDLHAPTWLVDVSTTPLRVTCNEGDTARFNGRDFFTWDADSALREANVRYEWKLRGVVFGREANFKILTDSVVKILGSENPFESGHTGTFSIIDKATGIAFMARFVVTINSRFRRYDLLILSEKGDQSRLSHVIRRSAYAPDGVTVVAVFRLADRDVYKTVNGNDIPGKPITLAKSLAKNVGSLGSMTILTDQVAYVINNENMAKVSELKDEFLDGPPENLHVVDRHDCDNYTYITTRDGRIFRRIMSENYLGGKFISEPYSVDNKGYKVSTFGHAASNKQPVPCYDEKNRRVLINGFRYKYLYNPFRSFEINTIEPVTKGGGNKDNLPPVWGMPEGSEVLYLSRSRDYTIFYNDPDGKTYMGDFALSSTNVCKEVSGIRVWSFPGGNLDKSSLFLTTVFNYGPRDVVVYTKGNEVRYVDRGRNNADHLFHQFDSKVTYIGYITYQGYYDYNKLMVGLENGKFFIYEFNRNNFQLPKTLLSEFDVEGKVVSAMELHDVYGGDAY
ncbi:PKD-like family lipoprotein [Sanguibacteroides justesenii]|nr:PKD-like family lipoprotein [Sanguibacteroides justesenii]